MKKFIALLAAITLFAAIMAGCAPASTASVSVKQSATAAGTATPVTTSAVTKPASTTSETTASTPDEANSTKMTSKTVTEYIGSADKKSTATLYFANGQTDIPFIEVNDAATLLNKLGVVLKDDKMKFTTSDNNGVITMTRENGAKAEIDFNKKLLLYYDFNKLFIMSYSSTALDILCQSGFDAKGQPTYFSREGVTSFERSGDPIEVDLGKDGIPMYYENGKGYIPLQTLSDLFMSQFEQAALYNGEALFVVGKELSGDIKDAYYSVPTGKRSEALAQFTYDELTLVLNMFYSLKDSHGIDSFEHLFEQTGLDKDLKSTDPAVVDTAMDKLCNGYFADGHSRFMSPSFYAGKDSVKTNKENASNSLIQFVITEQIYMAARAKAYPSGTPAYEEIGDTAYITFDSFTLPDKTDYYATPAAADAADTIGIIQYAHSQITRKGSPVKNVVLDLSTNLGGDADAAIYVVGSFLGSCTMNVNDTLTGAKASTQYKVDVNGDRKFDENDTFGDRNLFCITSPGSFSCGNLVPAIFKSSGKVGMLGRKSGGGTGVVSMFSLADGTMFNISGNKSVSTVTNGSYYDVDGGVEPDYTIYKIDDFYNRKTLTKQIDGLY